MEKPFMIYEKTLSRVYNYDEKVTMEKIKGTYME